MRTRGFTLIELLVAAVITGFVTLAVTQAYVLGINYSRRAEAARSTEDARIRFEDRISSLLRLSRLTTDTADRLSYFIGQVGNGNTSGAPGNRNNTSDTLTFTVAGQRLPGAVAASTDDFETINSQFGPQGGTAEVSFESSAIADTSNQQGVFLRIQRPADGDPTQGGEESVLDADVSEMGFEFFDGTNWLPTWNTQTGARRIPAAVRITYRLRDEDDDRVLIVRLPQSDVTPNNPVPAGTSG